MIRLLRAIVCHDYYDVNFTRNLCSFVNIFYTERKYIGKIKEIFIRWY